MADLRLDLLGGLHISSPSGTPIGLNARKARALLAYLALSQGRAQPRDKLAALFWADSNAEQARTSLRQALSAVRKALEEAGPGAQQALVADADRVGLCRADVDVVEFEQCLRDGSPAGLERAAGLYRGDLLEGVHAAAPAFDHWLAIERERLRGVALDALGRLLAHYEQAGEVDRAIATAVRLLSFDTLNEGAHRSLMRLYDKQGRQALALKQYRLCHGALQRELGVSPEPETEALHRAILRARRAEPAGAAQAPAPRHAAHADVAAAPEVDMPPASVAAAQPASTPASAAAAASAAPTPLAPAQPSPMAAPQPRPTASSGPELRHAVVVVASIDDAAAHAAGLDPEQMHDVLSRWRERAKSLANACGGRLTADIGPRLTVVFGVPVAHGNDAERALHMAVALHGALRDMPAGGSAGLLARVGAASGQVLAAFGDAGMTLTGAPVSVAVRVMEHAQPGQTLVSNRVCLALPGRLDTEFVTDLAMPGIPELIKLWRVRRLLSADETPPQHAFVGRQGELLQLAGVADDCLRSGRGRVVVIRGEAGIGKSRLADRFVALAREHGMEAHRALVLDFGAGSSGDPLRMLVRSLLGVASGTDDHTRAALVARAVSQGQVDEDDIAFAYDLLELAQPPSQAAALAAMDATVRQRGVHRFVTALATRKSAGKALLIVFEDVHWAEPALLECLAQLACATRGNRLTLALTVRAEQDPLDNAWRAAASGAAFTTIDLGPLNDMEARQLAARYRSLDPALADSCIRRAEGNPLFLDQLLRNVASPGNGHADEEALPGTLQSIVLARLDRLPHAERQALQAAAVLGQRFSQAALRHVLDDAGYSCERLVQHAMARPEGEDYLFMHALIHEAVYASLLKSRRLDLHRRAAGWYEGRDPALYAEHLDAANDPTAAQAYESAARHEAAHFRNERALRLTNRALRIAGDGAARQSLACLRGELTLDLGQPAESLAAFRQAVESAADDRQRARAWIGVASAQRLLDRYEEALHALEQAQRAASPGAEPDVLAQIESLRGNVHFPMGNMEACLAAHQRALHHADAAGSPLAAARALGGLGDAYYQQGRMLTARTHFERCVALARARGFIRIEGANLPMMGALCLYCNDVRGALSSCEEALRIARRIGDARIEILGCDVMVSAEQWIGDWVKAEAMGRRALAVAQRLGARRFEAELLARVGLAVGKQDRVAEAEPMLDEALALGHASGVRYSGPTILGFIARTTRDPDKQRRALEQGVAILAQGCVSHCYLDLHEAAIEVSLDARRWEDAERYASELEAYVSREPFPWATFLVARTRALAAAGRGIADDAVVSRLRELRQQALDVGLIEPLYRIDAALAAIGRAEG